MMLPEHRGTSYANDQAKGTIIVVTDAPPSRLIGDVAARLLLDAGQHLVGIDVSPDTPERMVVMLGAHESVASTLDARVRVEGGGRTVTLHGSAAKAVALGASPYVP
jgi:hypothetical protein